LGANVVKLEDLKDLIKDVDKLPKESRDKLYFNAVPSFALLHRLAG